MTVDVKRHGAYGLSAQHPRKKRLLMSNRAPTTPGEMLQTEYLAPLGMTQAAFARHLGVTTETINRLRKGKQAMSTAMALRLAKALGTTPEFWLNLQRDCDLWNVHREIKTDLRAIKPLKMPK